MHHGHICNILPSFDRRKNNMTCIDSIVGINVTYYVLPLPPWCDAVIWSMDTTFIDTYCLHILVRNNMKVASTSSPKTLVTNHHTTQHHTPTDGNLLYSPPYQHQYHTNCQLFADCVASTVPTMLTIVCSQLSTLTLPNPFTCEQWDNHL
jgi:hypothetical protein